MKHRPASILALTLLFTAGCATNEPSPAMREWARQQVAEKQRAETEAKHAQEIARLKAENERIQAQAEADRQKAEVARRQAEATAWVAANKKALLEDLTKRCTPHMQSLMENYGIQGKALGLFAEDIEMKGNVLYSLVGIVWQNRDGTGGFARALSGQNLVTNETVRDEIVEKTDLTQQQLATWFRENNATEVVTTDAKKPSVWAPSNETVNSGYQAAIKVAATAATIAIMNILQGN